MTVRPWLTAVLVAAGGAWARPQAAPAPPLEIAVSFGPELGRRPRTGRLLVCLSTNDEAEPRFQVNGMLSSMQVFGVDVDALAPGQVVVVGPDAFGYPRRSLLDLPPRKYRVQAVLNEYESFTPAHGHTVWLPPERGEGQHWNRKPGNLYSTPRWVRIDPAAGGRVELRLDREIEPVVPPQDTAYIRHVTMKSEILSSWWGRDVELGAHVLVPRGFDEHPEARYPLCIFHGHFPADFGGFRPEPPDPDLEPDYSARFDVHGYNRIQQEEAHAFYEMWTGDEFPRFLIVEIQHANPFYDDSYAVNSENLGPYGDAITYELVPFLEQRFRGLGQGWSRFLYGGSTGGWEALAAQVFYPTEYNGCFAACPDPVDFRAYCLVNLYQDENAYWLEGPFDRIERPAHRDWLGRVTATVRQQNHYELALGSHGRSGEQWDVWQAVYSPVGPDGYPAPIWDKLTGRIDHDVAEYWREHYDLRSVLESRWSEIGPDLVGKIHVYCGDMDNWYLNDAVYLLEQFLEGTKAPYYAGEVDYGDRAEHCWNGDHEHPNAISRLRYNWMYLPRILARIEATAPAGADLTSWRY